MTNRCVECGGDLVEGQCEICGLTPQAAEFVLRRRLLYGTALFLLGAIAFLAAVSYYPPLDLDAMMIFVGVLFFSVMGLAIWLDLKARRHTTIQPLKRGFYGLLAVPWLLAGLLFANGRFDASPVDSQITRVVGKFAMPGTLKNSRLVVISWRQDRKIERIPIHRDEFVRFRVNDTVEIHVREGLAGIPWVDSVYLK